MTNTLLLKPDMVFQGRYRVIDMLAQGGMGAVYEVEHIETRRRLALKTMLRELVRDDDLRARFRREAHITANIESDHIVQVVDAGLADNGMPYLVLELLRGVDLGRMLEDGPLDVPLAMTLLQQCAMALDKTHAAGIIHRDLKPPNLYVCVRDDGSPNLKVLDFGIAKLVAESGVRNTTRSIGTPAYMPPEQFAGEGPFGPPTDNYALAHIAYELLVGVTYWEEDLRAANYALVMRKLGGGIKEPATMRARRSKVALPDAFDDWFIKATAFSPDERFARASEMVEALGAALANGVTHLDDSRNVLSKPTLHTFVNGGAGPRSGELSATAVSAEVTADPTTVPQGRRRGEDDGVVAAQARSLNTGGDYQPVPAAATIPDPAKPRRGVPLAVTAALVIGTAVAGMFVLPEWMESPTPLSPAASSRSDEAASVEAPEPSASDAARTAVAVPSASAVSSAAVAPSVSASASSGPWPAVAVPSVRGAPTSSPATSATKTNSDRESVLGQRAGSD